MPSGTTIDNNIKAECVLMSKQGKSAKQIYDTYFHEKSPETSLDAFSRSLLNWKKGEPNVKHIALENFTPKKHVETWGGNQIVKFGIISDTHIGSKQSQITWLHNFYHVIEREEIPIVYHVGDICEGEHMRTGQEYEIYCHGADEFTEEVANVYPKVNGVTTKFITGNHDSSFYKSSGTNIGKSIAKERSDMIYLGRDIAVVNITPKCTLELRHPWDGTAYSDSYKLQKIVEAMEPDNKPNILAVGHYHKALYMFKRNVHCFLAGCTQRHTLFTIGHNISIAVGAWIVTVEVDDRGYIQRIIPELIPFYYPINDDYKNWR